MSQYWNQVVKRVNQTYCILKKWHKTRQSSLRATPRQTTNMHCENAVYTSRTVYFVHIYFTFYTYRPIRFVVLALRLVLLSVSVWITCVSKTTWNVNDYWQYYLDRIMGLGEERGQSLCRTNVLVVARLLYLWYITRLRTLGWLGLLPGKLETLDPSCTCVYMWTVRRPFLTCREILINLVS